MISGAVATPRARAPRRRRTARSPLPPKRDQLARISELDAISRSRALSDAESRELERLLMADYTRRLRCGITIPRGIA